MAADARAPRRRRGSRRPLPLIVGLPLLALVISAMYWHSVLASALTPTRPGDSIVAGAPAAAPVAPIVGPAVGPVVGPVVGPAGRAGLDAGDVTAGLAADATDRGTSSDRYTDGYTDRHADGYTGPAGDAPRSAFGAVPVAEAAAVVSGARPAAASQRALAAIGQRAPPRPTV